MANDITIHRKKIHTNSTNKIVHDMFELSDKKKKETKQKSQNQNQFCSLYLCEIRVR